MMTRFKIFDHLRGKLYPDEPELNDMPVLLLIYLVFLSMPWVVGGQASVAMTLLSVALFLPLYFMQWWHKRLSLIVLGMWLIWFFLSKYNWGMNTYIIYACAVAGLMPSTRHAVASVALMLIGMCLVLKTINAPLEAFLMPTLMSVIVFLGSRAQRESMRAQAFLRLSQQEISKLAERNERERIAREVHDLLGHSLTLISLKADLALKLIDKDLDAAKSELRQINDTARESLGEVRQAVHGMRSAQISVEIAKSKLACEVADLDLLVDIPPDLALVRSNENVLAAVIREAINNTIRHAKATQVSVTIQDSADATKLLVADNGKSRDFREGSGLCGMRERVQAIGGKIEFSAALGFTVRVEIPQANSSVASAATSGVFLSNH
jgi:two-component system, NarL family, sensor histidine kinase DesK